MQIFGGIVLNHLTPPRSIKVETHKSTDVPNEIACEPSQADKSRFNQLLARNQDWKVRKLPCGVYNCAGHVWASRRTAIYDRSSYDMILKDDGYRMLDDSEYPPAIGDLAVYRCMGMPFHVGVVAEIREEFNVARPYVLSKPNDGMGEVIHPHLPMTHLPQPCDIEYWTDRKQQSDEQTT
jgi:hypothetical protein